jgi:excinuclease ABC subunit C
MAEVVRRRYSRVLLEGREKLEQEQTRASDGERDGNEEQYTDAYVDYSASQESPVEQMERVAEAQARAGQGMSGLVAVRLPDLVIVDGGKGQLSSACKELQRLGLSELPIIGLAKEFEEIYRPAHPLPLRLPESSGALRLLQRIRDEAHRFANGFHQLLMKRRIAESLLDDCPGVSQTRKQVLLKKFGSVARIKRATPEQIAELAGIGPRLAQQIHEYLQERA